MIPRQIPSRFAYFEMFAANCNANSGFKPVASGGDGATTQYCECLSSLINRVNISDDRAGFVGYDPALKTVIVSHQGTDTSKMFVHSPFRSSDLHSDTGS